MMSGALVFFRRHVRKGTAAIASLALISAAGASYALNLSPHKPIRLVGEEIEVVLDPEKREVRLARFSIDKNLPTGPIHYRSTAPYVMRWIAIPLIKEEGVTTLKLTDLSDGVGVKLDIRMNVSKSRRSVATVNVTVQHEETTVFYSAQQLDVKQD